MLFQAAACYYEVVSPDLCSLTFVVSKIIKAAIEPFKYEVASVHLGSARGTTVCTAGIVDLKIHRVWHKFFLSNERS